MDFLDPPISKAKLNPVGTGFIPIGDSTTAGPDRGSGSLKVQQSEISFATQAAWSSNKRLQMIRNAGIGGNTTSQMLARFQADVLDWNPSIIHIMGGLNDMGGGTDEATIVAQVALAYSNLTTMAKQGRATGARVVIGICWGKPFAGEKMRRLGEQLKSFCRQHDFDCIDYAEAVLGTGSDIYVLPVASSRSGDRTHLNQANVYIAAQLLVDWAYRADIRPARARWTTSDIDALNTITDGTFQSGNTGGVPSGWTGSGSPTAGTIVSTVESPDIDDDIDGNWWHIQGTNYQGGKLYQQSFSVGTGLAIEPGDQFRICFRLIAKNLTADAAYTIGTSFTGGTGFNQSPIVAWTTPFDGWVTIEDCSILTTGTTVTAITPFVQIVAATNVSNLDLYLGQFTYENMTKSGNLPSAEKI